MTKTEFQQNGFIIIKQLIDPNLLNSAMEKAKETNSPVEDPSIKNSYYIYKHPECEKLLVELLPTLEKHAGFKLYKTYSFIRYYSLGNILPSHRDRPGCEITVSICLGYKDKPWPICLMNRNEEPQSVILEPGDAIMFYGQELTHWRSKNTYGECSQVFFHYVNQDGPFAIHKDDISLVRNYSFRMFRKYFNLTVSPEYK